jgi:PEGA domain
MNFVFFTIELERDAAPQSGTPGRTRAVRRGQHRSGRWTWALLALVSIVTAATGGWLLAGGDPSTLGLPDWVPFVPTSASAQTEDQGRLSITSQPDGALVTVDGHSRGTTPLTLSVSRGVRTLLLTHSDAVDDVRQVSVGNDTRVRVAMWLRRPNAVQLRPAFPGASLTDARFLNDGRLALSMAVPDATTTSTQAALREPWMFDPATGNLNPFVMNATRPRAALVSVSPDGHQLAYVKPGTSTMQMGGPPGRMTEVRVGTSDGAPAPTRVLALPGDGPNLGSSTGAAETEEVHDVTWTPDSRHLLVTVRLAAIARAYSPAPRSRLLLVDASTDDQPPAPPTELLTLPADVVVGTYVWAPDGHWAAFLTQAAAGPGGADFVALCAVDTSARGAISGFRYVADLGRLSDASRPMPIAAVAWSATGDGRLAYAAPTLKLTVSNPLGLPTTSGGEPGLFVARPGGATTTAEEGQRLGSATGLIAPAWPGGSYQDGSGLLALARSDQGNRPLVVREIDPVTGITRDLGVTLPPNVAQSSAVSARWDLAHGSLLVVARRDNSYPASLDYWLVQLRAEERGE